MDLLGTGRVLTIDIVNKHQDVEHPRIDFLDGSSTDPAIVEQVRRAAEAADGPVMVILDGNHDRDHVAQELELYGPLVTPGSLLLSQDGVIDKIWFFRDTRPGPAGGQPGLPGAPPGVRVRPRAQRALQDHPPPARVDAPAARRSRA